MWMPPIQCPFASPKPVTRSSGLTTILARYNEVSTILAEQPAAYQPIFMTDARHVIVAHWAAGFMRGTGLRVVEWSPILLTDMRAKLTPIFVSHDLGAGFLPDVPSAGASKCPDALCSPQHDPCYRLFWVVLVALRCTTFAEAVDLDAGWIRRTPG
jgi:hypothetical protein